jgi:TolB-like protein/DNA-binding winged helix-turn-helix (wHTH) protein/Tfp pilus assembly protein PilF
MPPPLAPGNGSSQPRFRLGDLEVDVATAEVSRGDAKIPLPKLSFDLLCALINAAPAIVTNDELLQRVWPGVLVSPESVAQRVKLLRTAIGDDSQQPRYILGVRGRGYRLIPAVERLTESRLPISDATNPPANTYGATIPDQPISESFSPKGSNSLLKRVGIAVVVFVAISIAVVLALRFWSSSHNSVRHTAVAMVDKSIAVLPFVDMSEKKDQEYFADGMAEEIIDLLVKVPGLKVISRTSSFQFKGKTEDLRKIGSLLGVAYVLEGSVRKSGDHLRVSAQLVNSKDGTRLWSQTYDRDLSDVLKMQDEIAIALVRALQIEVGTDDIGSRTTPRNMEAYTLYLQGLHAEDSFDQQGLEQAAGYFQRTIELDPSFAAAEIELGHMYAALGVYGFMPAPVALEKGRLADERAVELDPNLAVAHAALGEIHRAYDWDWAAADREIKLALALAPNDGNVLFLGAIQSLNAGRLDEALQRINAASAKNPLAPEPYTILNMIQLRRGRLVEAEAAGRRALELRPMYSGGHYFIAVTLLVRGEPQDALMESMKETQEPVRLAGSAMAYFALGRKADSDAALEQMTLHPSGHPFFIAQVYAFRGETDEALKWLERAYDQKDSGGLPMLKGDPLFRKIEEDPRYKAFLKKMNFPDE